MKPLKGLTVLDLSRVLAGPYCGMLLADLGATVIKVEHPEGGDDARDIGPFVQGKSAYYAALNRGKQSIALDLKDESHRKVFEKLLETADVLLENFSAGAMERLGYGYADLKQRYPELIYVAISGFGGSGPMKGLPAYDIIAQAMGGLMSITGDDRGHKVARVGASVGDVAAALFATIGLLAALHKRQTTKKGDKLDISMLDCQVALLENALARYFIDKKRPRPLGARHPTITPFDLFQTEDRPIALAAANERVFARVVKALGSPPGLKDRRFADNKLRTANHKLLKSRIEAVLRSRPAAFWLKRLRRQKAPASLVNGLDEVVKNPQLRHRKMIVKTVGSPVFRFAGNPIKMATVRDSGVRPPPPELGQDGERIKRQLGFKKQKTE